MFYKKITPFVKRVFILNIAFLILIGIAAYFVLAAKTEQQKKISLPLPTELYQGLPATSTPVSLSIPSLNVEAKVAAVGRALSGNMAVPTNYEDVGWYKHGPVPGQSGNAVIAGHLDDGKGNGAVFSKLSEITIGDLVYVTTDTGERIAFAVREIRLVDYSNPPLQEIFGKSFGMHLNIITCDGTWIPEKRMYDKRLVVFTDRVALEI